MKKALSSVLGIIVLLLGVFMVDNPTIGLMLGGLVGSYIFSIGGVILCVISFMIFALAFVEMK